MSVKIVIACGSGIATSTVVEVKIRDIAQDNGLDITTNKMSMNELQSSKPEADLVITTSNYRAGDVGVKVLSGTPLLTGIGEEEFTEKLIAEVKELSK